MRPTGGNLLAQYRRAPCTEHLWSWAKGYWLRYYLPMLCASRVFFEFPDVGSGLSVNLLWEHFLLVM